MEVSRAQFRNFGARLVGMDGLRAGALSRQKVAIICLSLFLLALGVRLLQWQNSWLIVDKTMTRLTARYKEEAQFLLGGDLTSFVRGSSVEPDGMILAHPPGYPILLAAIYRVSGHSDTAMRLFQICADALAALLVFLTALRLFPKGAAIIAGLLVALSPQLAYNCLPLLPDSLSGLPILLALYLIVRASQSPNILLMMAAGAAIGVSCWLRANSLLLAPFLCLLIFALFESSQRWRYSLVLVATAFLVIAPITIRNAIVFRSFIPLSLGGGLNLFEGIADYDPEKRFGLESSDDGVTQQEAVLFNRPDYAAALYQPDGVARERSRYARAMSVIRTNKVWFLGVMVRRAGSMLASERVPIISAEPSVTRPLEITNQTELAWSASPPELLAALTPVSRQAQLSLSGEHRALRIMGDDSEQAIQFVSTPISLKGESDYLLRLPVRTERGRMVMKVTGVGKGETLASAIFPDSVEKGAPMKDSLTYVSLPFVTGETAEVRITLANAGSTQERPIIEVGDMELYRLGPASYLWTRYPRWPLKVAQKFFRTGWVLPLALVGIILLALAGRWGALSIALSIPAYYLCVHSPLHVEPRYILAIHYGLLLLVAVALYWVAMRCWQLLLAVKGLKPQAHMQETK